MQFDITLLSNIIKFFNEAFEWSTEIKVSKVYLLLFKKTWLTVNSHIFEQTDEVCIFFTLECFIQYREW